MFLKVPSIVQAMSLPAPTSEGLPPKVSSSARTSRHLVIGVAVVIAVVLLAALLLTNGFHSTSGSKPVVLVPESTLYSLPGQQFSAVGFSTQKTATLSGTIANTQGINLYLMTPNEVTVLSKSGVVEGYTWSSGRIANLTTTSIDLSIQPGQWDIVFLNSAHVSLLNQTEVTFYSDLTLTSR